VKIFEFLLCDREDMCRQSSTIRMKESNLISFNFPITLLLSMIFAPELRPASSNLHGSLSYRTHKPVNGIKSSPIPPPPHTLCLVRCKSGTCAWIVIHGSFSFVCNFGKLLIIQTISGGGWEFFSSPPCPERVWGPSSFLSKGYTRGSFPGGKVGEIKNEWSCTSTPHYAFMA
jgi:hypothetical protein